MDCRGRLETFFREHDVAFDVEEHPPAFTAQRVAAVEHVPGRTFAKVVIARADGQLVMLVLPAPKMVDLAKAAALLSREDVHLVPEWEFAPTFPDCQPGAMPPFGNLYGVPVYVDAELARAERIVFQAGTHTLTMSVAYADFERTVRPIAGAITV